MKPLEDIVEVREPYSTFEHDDCLTDVKDLKEVRVKRCSCGKYLLRYNYWSYKNGD
jgi:hypothetical protein